jgi:Zn-dependent protease
MNIERFVVEFVVLAPPFLLALTVHELAHGYAALKLGDPTASRAGRLTWNPLKHLDPMGVLCFFLLKIGWAKPVPVNAAYFKNPRQDMLVVSLAGPGANVLLGVASAVLVKIVLFLDWLPVFFLQPLAQMLAASIWINIMLAVFNFLPIPPLDGSKILMGLLPARLAASFARLENFGFIILLILFYTGILSSIIMPIISFAHGLLVR